MKWVAWLLKLSITVVMVSVLTVATTGYVVNWYIQSLLGSYNIPLEVQSPNLGSMMKGMLGFGGQGTGSKNPGSRKVDETDHKNMNASANTGTDGNSAGNSNGDRAGSGSENSEGGVSNGNESDRPDEDGVNTGEGIPEDALPVMGGMASGQSQQQSQQDALGNQDQAVVISPDDLLAKKDELPDQQKEEIFNILMSKLPEEEMQKMTAAMEGGLTESEMIEIQQILSKHLDKEQYAKVMDLLKK